MTLLEKYLIDHCAPTLASLKTACLFWYSESTERELEEQIQIWNQRLQENGLFLMVLNRRKEKALVYVCRKSHLEADLQKPGAARFLTEYGYQKTDVGYALSRLKKRLAQEGAFPHEIGIFLGYPLGDVIGFIRNRGQNCKCTGCWKVYCNECEAIRLFAQFRKCREIYGRLWNQGKSVRQLTVAA